MKYTVHCAVFWHKWHSQTQGLKPLMGMRSPLLHEALFCVPYEDLLCFSFQTKSSYSKCPAPSCQLVLCRKNTPYKHLGVVLHNRLHATTEKLQYRCSNRVRPFPLQCWSSPWRRQDLGRGNNIILKGNKELITDVVRLIFWTPKRHVILHSVRIFSPLSFRTYLWGQSCWYLSGSKPFGERTETPGIWISSCIIEHVMNATISK